MQQAGSEDDAGLRAGLLAACTQPQESLLHPGCRGLHGTTAWKAGCGEGEADGPSSKGDRCCAAHTTPEPDKAPAGPLPGACLCSSGFAPARSRSLHGRGRSQADSCQKENSVSHRPRLSFRVAWALLAHCLFLAQQKHLFESASLQGPQSIASLPVIGRDGCGVVSRRGPPSLHLLPDPQGSPGSGRPGPEAPRQPQVWEAVVVSLSLSVSTTGMKHIVSL